jgi:predicted phage terminase large subunit-like protein
MLASYPVGYLREQELYGEFADPGGNLGDPKWFRDKVLKIPPENVKRRVRYWDLAASERKISGPSGKKLTDPDETVGTLLSWQEEESEDRFCIEDQVSGAMVWKDIKEKIKVTAERDGPYVPVYVEQEPGSGGINQLAALFEWLEEELPGWHFEEHNPRDQGDKIMRANIWFAEAAQGKFSMVEGKWNESFLKQLASFPSGKHDDKVDSISGARIMIAPIRRWKKIEFMHLNMKKDEENKV